MDVSQIDPRNPEHEALIDAAFGLEKAIPFGSVRPHHTLFESQIRDTYGDWDVLGSVPFPWSSFSSPAERAKATSDVELLLNRLYREDADIVRLSLAGVRQSEIGRRFGITQMSVCYKIRRAMRLMRLAARMPDLTPEELVPELAAAVWKAERHLLADRIAAIAVAMADTYWVPNQGAVSAASGTSQQTLSAWCRRVRDVLPPDHPFVVVEGFGHRMLLRRAADRAPQAIHRGPDDGIGADVARRLGVYMPMRPRG